MRAWPPFLVVFIPIFALFLVYGLLFASTQVAWSPYQLWSDQFGTTHPVSMGSSGVTAVSSDGNNLFVAGYLGFAPVPISRNGTLFVRMYDSSYRAVWTRTFGNATIDEVDTIVSGKDAIYVGGRLNESAFVTKFDLNGVAEWTDQKLQELNPETRGLSVGPSVYSAGTFYANQTYHIFLRSLSLSGSPQWTRLVANYSGEVHGLYQQSGALYLAGVGPVSVQGNGLVVQSFLGKYDLQGRQVWVNTFEPLTVQLSGISADSSGVYILGVTDHPFPGQSLSSRSDAFIRKYSFDGSVSWTVEFGPPDYSGTTQPQFSVGTSGIYVVMQSVVGNTFLFSFDSGGRNFWNSQISAPAGSLNAMAADSRGIYFGGSNRPEATLSQYSLSESLIFFGLVPPFSFLAIAAIIAAVTLAVVFMSRHWNRKRSPGSNLSKTRLTRCIF